MSESIIYEQDQRVVTITLNRPDTRNALSGDLIEIKMLDALY
jgi:enoyl-CoA hydratase/carnithine racemase